MNHFLRFLFLFSFVISVFSCKKNDTDGYATLVAFPKHHGMEIKGATLFVKFKADDLPSDPTNNYDLKIVGETNENHIHVHDLRYGKYYLYTEGFDSSMNEKVKGGLAIKIKWSERKKEIDVDIPVTE